MQIITSEKFGLTVQCLLHFGTPSLEMIGFDKNNKNMILIVNIGLQNSKGY